MVNKKIEAFFKKRGSEKTMTHNFHNLVLLIILFKTGPDWPVEPVQLGAGHQSDQILLIFPFAHRIRLNPCDPAGFYDF